MESLGEKIEKIAQPFLAAMDAELVDLHVNRYRGNLTIQILADKAGGGITIGECSQLNRKIGDAIENENFMAQRYILEVSSPGADRPLKTTRDFKRVNGRQVHFYLSEPINEKIEYVGVVKEIQEEEVTVDCKSTQITIPIDKIQKAKQIIHSFKEG